MSSMILDSADFKVKRYVLWLHARKSVSSPAGNSSAALLQLSARVVYRAPLLDCAGGLREDGVGVRSDQTYGSYYEDQNHCQHDGVLGNVLPLFVRP